jgi:hypothetical protein
MYLSGGDLTGIIIALVACMILISILTYANYVLLKENRFLRYRMRVNRTAYLQFSTDLRRETNAR